jgi:hypothetical protein
MEKVLSFFSFVNKVFIYLFIYEMALFFKSFLFIYSPVHTLLGPFLPLPSPPACPPHFQAEPVLPFSPILLKRRHKQ